MVRPHKEGWDYFPFDTNLDKKIQAVESVFKNNGFVWVVKFWQEAYRNNQGEVYLGGYHGVIHADNCRITQEEQSEIIKLCLEIGLICKVGQDIYSSNGIKKRVAFLLKNREKWRTHTGKSVINADNQVDNIVDNEKETPQSKVKESKEKNIYIYDFESLWVKYPKRVGRAKAYTHFKSTVKTEKDYLDIQTAFKNYLESKRVRDGYIQDGSTWFKNWRDWVDYKEPQKGVVNDLPKLQDLD